MPDHEPPIEYLLRRRFGRTRLLSAPILPLGSNSSIPTLISHENDRMTEYRAELETKTSAELADLVIAERAREAEELRRKAELEEAQQFFNQPHATADLDHWSKMTYWTLEEAIALSFGKEPKIVNSTTIQGHVNISPFAREYARILERARRAVAWGQLYDPVLPQIYLAWARRDAIPVSPELVKLIEARGVVIADWKDLYESTRAQLDTVIRQRDAYRAALEAAQAERDRVAEGPKRSWPWGEYSTELLEHLAAAARKWWVNYDPTDPSTAPTNEQVEKWLREERKVSGRVAESMAQILRAEGLPHGPRRK